MTHSTSSFDKLRTNPELAKRVEGSLRVILSDGSTLSLDFARDDPELVEGLLTIVLSLSKHD